MDSSGPPPQSATNLGKRKWQLYPSGDTVVARGEPTSPWEDPTSRTLRMTNDATSKKPGLLGAALEDPRSALSELSLSDLPHEILQHIFSFVDPISLGCLICVNRSFRILLDPAMSLPQPSGRVKSLSIRRQDLIWATSRKTFLPGFPKPMEGATELDMWKLIRGNACQFCGKRPLLSPPTPGSSPWNAGPGSNGVRPIWPFRIRSCSSCLEHKIIKESKLLLSSSNASILCPGLPFAIFTSLMDYVPSVVLQQMDPPPQLRLTKYYYIPQLDEMQLRMKEVQGFGPAATEGWYKGLEEMGRLLNADAARLDQWEMQGGPVEDEQSDGDLSEVSSGPPSLVSNSTDSSIHDKYNDAVQHLVEIFCEDENIGPIYREAVESFRIHKFHQNHDQLLKLYFKELRQEINNETELATIRLLRTRRCRNEITALILKCLTTFETNKSPLTMITLAERKTERNYNLNKFIQSATIVPGFYENHNKQRDGGKSPEDDASESDGSSDSHQELLTDEQSPLQAIDNFLTGGKAFTQLKVNLSSLLHSPRTLEDALLSKSIFVVKQYISRNQNDWADKDRETILEHCERGQSTTELAEILLEKSMALLAKLMEEDQDPALTKETMTAEPAEYGGSQVHDGPQLVTWTCSCGMELRDYYTEIVPGSLEQLQQRLKSEHSRSLAPWNILWNTFLAWATSRPSVAQVSPNSQSRAMFENQSAQAAEGITQRITSGNASASTPSRAQSPSSSVSTFVNLPPHQAEPTVSYLLLCFPEGLSGLKLYQQQILQKTAQQNLPNLVMNDKQLFCLLRKKYNSERRVFMSRFWPKTVIRVSLAYFLVDLSEYVELKHYACHAGGANCRCIPPPDMIRPANNAQYHCIPREPRLRPPIGPNYLTHYFQNPHCIKTENLVCTLNQLPKRLGQCMATSGSERVEAWGIEFEEGWDRGKLRNAVFSIVTIGCLIFAILWSVLEKDMQSAFGVSGFIIATLAIIGGYVASAEPRIVHK